MLGVMSWQRRKLENALQVRSFLRHDRQDSPQEDIRGVHSVAMQSQHNIYMCDTCSIPCLHDLFPIAHRHGRLSTGQIVVPLPRSFVHISFSFHEKLAVYDVQIMAHPF